MSDLVKAYAQQYKNLKTLSSQCPVEDNAGFSNTWIAAFDALEQMNCDGCSMEGAFEDMLKQCMTQPAIIKHAINVLGVRLQWTDEHNSLLDVMTEHALTCPSIRQLWCECCHINHPASVCITPEEVIKSVFTGLQKVGVQAKNAFVDESFIRTLQVCGRNCDIFGHRTDGVFTSFVEYRYTTPSQDHDVWDRCLELVVDKNVRMASKWDLGSIDLDKMSQLKNFNPLRYQEFFHRSEFSHALRLRNDALPQMLNNTSLDNTLPFVWAQLTHEKHNDTFFGVWEALNQALFNNINQLDPIQASYHQDVEHIGDWITKVASYTNWKVLPAQIFGFFNREKKYRYQGDSVLSEHGHAHRKILTMMGECWKKHQSSTDYDTWQLLTKMFDQYNILDYVLTRDMNLFAQKSEFWNRYFQENPNHYLCNIIKPLSAFGECDPQLLNRHQWGNQVLPDMAAVVLALLFKNKKWNSAWDMVLLHHFGDDDLKSRPIDFMASSAVEQKDTLVVSDMFRTLSTAWPNQLNEVFNQCITQIISKSAPRDHRFDPITEKQTFFFDTTDRDFVIDFLKESQKYDCVFDKTYIKRHIQYLGFKNMEDGLEEFLAKIEKMIIGLDLPSHQPRKKRII